MIIYSHHIVIYIVCQEKFGIRRNGGLPPWGSTVHLNRIRNEEVAMSLYEFLDLLFTAIQICLDIIQRLHQRWVKKSKNKK